MVKLDLPSKKFINIIFRIMKRILILLAIFLAISPVIFGQDTLRPNEIYAPNMYNNNISAEESWEIHKAAYIKQLKSEGLTEAEIKSSMLTYEKEKKEFIALVKEQHRIAKIQRKKAEELRALAEIQRAKAAEQRKLADVQRKQAEELRILADEQRKKSSSQRTKAEELRKEARHLRALADEQRKIADIQRAMAEEKRRVAEEWRKRFRPILKQTLKLSKKTSKQPPINFTVSSKTSLQISIIANISSGSTLIEIYNPKGVKEGELSLKFNSLPTSGQVDEKLDYSSGSLHKTISGADAGEWLIKIFPNQSDGSLAIAVAEYEKPSSNE